MKVINFILLVVGVVSFTACGGSSSSSSVEALDEKATVRFDLGELTGLANKSSKKQKSLEEAASVILSIKKVGEDASFIYSEKEMRVVKFGSNFVTEPITLTVDTFLLTKFLVLDANGVTIFATPLEGSDRARLVTNPLPIQFQSTKDQVVTVSPEVLDSDGFEPGDFGYGSFSLDLIETFAFQLTVFNEVDEQFAVTDAQLAINADSVNLFNGPLNAATNSIELRTGLNNYEVTVSKVGYDDYVKSFTESELADFSNAPLLIYLKKQQNQPPVVATKKIASGWNHTLALKNDGTVWAWGGNWNGQLGDGSEVNRINPVQVLNVDGSALINVVDVVAGSDHALCLKSDGTVWSWGYNYHGQLGDGTTTNRSYPVQILNADGSGLTNVMQIIAGGYHSICLRNDGTVWSWGANWIGQLGDGTTVARSLPTPVLNSDGSVLSDISWLNAGGSHTFCLNANGEVWSWGSNGAGQLGDGTTINRSSPVQVLNSDGSALSNVLQIKAGSSHTLCLNANGEVLSWGSNSMGQLGDGSTTNRSYPVQVLNVDGSRLVGVSEIVAGGDHSLCLNNNGTVLSWGNNNDGQLGRGTSVNTIHPMDVLNEDGSVMTNIIQVNAGGFHVLCFKNDGSLLSWGSNRNGQLGDGTTTNRSNPVNVLLADGSVFKLW